MNTPQSAAIGKNVELAQQIGIGRLVRDLCAIVVHARLGPGIEIENRNVEQPAVELRVVPFCRGRVKAQDLLRHILEADAVQIVGNLHRCHFGNELNDAADRGLTNRRSEPMHPEIQLDAHLVAKFHFDATITANIEARLVVDHLDLPS